MNLLISLPDAMFSTEPGVLLYVEGSALFLFIYFLIKWVLFELWLLFFNWPVMHVLHKHMD